MCIIAIQPKGIVIDEYTLRNCWENNNDGAGIMYSINGEVHVHKELNSFKKFMKFKKYVDSLNVNCVIHFRISTSGKIDKNNIHPFKVNDDLFFCHNGILDIDVPIDSLINDTQIYNNGILKNLPIGFEQNEGIRNLIQYSIGSKNKFVFLNSEGEFFILNENAGCWDEGAWYSNNTYQYSYSSNYYTPKSKGFKKLYDDEMWHPVECECCGCRHKDLQFSIDWDIYLCPSCNEWSIAK